MVGNKPKENLSNSIEQAKKWLSITTIIFFFLGYATDAVYSVVKELYFVAMVDSFSCLLFMIIYFSLKKDTITSQLAIDLLAIGIVSNILISYITYFYQPYFEAFVYRDVVIGIIISRIVTHVSGNKKSTIYIIILSIFFVSISLLKGSNFLIWNIPLILIFLIGSGFGNFFFSNLIVDVFFKYKETKDQLHRLYQFKQSVIGYSFHDLKVPLNSIIELSREKSTWEFDLINYHSENLKKQLENVLDIERLESAELVLEKSFVLISDIIEESMQVLGVLAKKKNIKIIAHYDTDFYLSCDKKLIERAMVNLLSNALKYSPVNEEITIKVNCINAYCRIAIKDKGEGIDERKIKNIFEKYYIVNSETTKKYDSSGLGLTYCKLAIEAHKGRIEAISDTHKGTEIIVWLPCEEKDKKDVSFFRVYKDEILFTPAEEEKLKKLCKDLQDIPIYKIGEIVTKVNRCILDNERASQSWKEKLFEALYTGNEDYYLLLLNMILKQEQTIKN